MFKMMIVDDQMKEINGIKEILDWNELGVEIVACSTNGKKGLEEALKIKPDIILSDIVMPIMDGLEMVQNLRKEMPDVKVIFMSCFDDFKFASQAINQGAFGYVLKPILPGELLKSVKKTIEICEEEKKNLNLINMRKKIQQSLGGLREQFFRNLIFGVFKDEEDILEQGRFLELEIGIMQYGVLTIELDASDKDETFIHAVSILESLKERYSREGKVYFIQLDLTNLAVLFTIDKGELPGIKKDIYQSAEAILDFINEEYNVPATAGMGSITDKLGEISSSYKSAQKALQYKFYLGSRRVVDTEEINITCSGTTISIENINDDIKQILLSGDRKLIENFISNFLTKGSSPNMLKYICFTIFNTLQLSLLQMQQNLEDILGDYGGLIEDISKLNTLEKLRKFMLSKFNSIIDFNENFNKIENKDIVKKMMAYISGNYGQQIMLEDVAGHVYLSPGYANFIFKNVTGKTIHQYLEDYRMEKACELLLENKELKVYRIAEKVGYTNSAYFVNVFRKMYGCTPTDFRKRNI